MNTVDVFVHLRDIRTGDIISGKPVSFIGYYSSDYQFTFQDGSILSGNQVIGDRLMITVDRPIPDGLLNWSDSIFKNAPVISAHNAPDGETWEASYDSTGIRQSDGLHEYMPVFVKGYYGDYLFENWSGVGPSNAPYTMKAMLRNDGKLCRPDSNYDRPFGCWCKPIVHDSSWVYPYVEALKNEA